MTLTTPPRMTVIKKEEKEQKLADLLATGLASADGAASGPRLCVLAQSLASPVVRAVFAREAQVRAAGYAIAVVVARLDTAELKRVAPTIEVRHLADMRCHDAHEMMALGTTTGWIGDSMRREPTIRDSYELHAADCPQTVARIIASFDRLWSRSQACRVAAIDLAGLLDLAAGLAARTAEQAPQVLTRH